VGWPGGRCESRRHGIDDAFGDVGGPPDVVGGDLPRRELSVLRERPIPSDPLGVVEVLAGRR
jgi:hypothetical protein